jgi:hypothetical protein
MVIQLLIQILLYILVFATFFPLGIFMSKLCADELVKDRKYFFLMACLSLILALILFFIYFKPAIIFSLLYLSLVLAVMIRKSRDKKFVKKYN